MPITLKAARVNAGLTQKAAAKAMGITKDTLSRWERGASFPDVAALKQIEAIYGANYNDLIFLPQNNALSVKDRPQNE